MFAVLTYFANLWPGWATSSATLVTYLFGGSVTVIAVVMLLVIGLVLTLAPVVYVALERAQMLKVAAVVLLFLVGAVFAIGAEAWADLPQVVTNPGIPAAELGFAVLLGALAFAGAGGGQNLVPVQLDPGQGLRDGQLRAAPGQPDHRRVGGGAEHRVHLRPRPSRTWRAGAAGGGSPTSSS